VIALLANKKYMAISRTIVFLNTWIEKYHEDFLEPEMSTLVASFDSTIAFIAKDEKDPFNIEKGIQKAASKKVFARNGSSC
jgi:hypothetical protein